jgi:hypothetical protein
MYLHVYVVQEEEPRSMRYLVGLFFPNSKECLMTYKYRGYIVVLSINKSVEPNEEQKVLTSSFDQGITVNTSKQFFEGIL